MLTAARPPTTRPLLQGLRARGGAGGHGKAPGGFLNYGKRGRQVFENGGDKFLSVYFLWRREKKVSSHLTILTTGQKTIPHNLDCNSDARRGPALRLQLTVE